MAKINHEGCIKITMKRTSKFLAVLLCIMTVFAVTCLPAMAAETTYELEGADITLSLPENTFVFSSTMADTDPQWAEAGITDPVECKTLYNELGVVAHFSMNNNKDNIYLSRKQTDTTSAYFNLGTLDKENLDKFVEKYNITEEGTMDSTAELYDHSQVPFVRTYIHSDFAQKDETVYEMVYFTIVNGYSVSFSMHGSTEFTEAQEQVMRNIVDSINFSNIIEKPVTPTASPVFAITVLVGGVALLIGLIVAFKISKSNTHKRTKILAEKLSAYRKERKTELGEMFFENTTDHSGEAIRIFSRYQTYHKNVLRGTVSIVVSVVGAVVSYQLNAAWWLTLALTAAALYCIYKFATGAGTIEKSMTRVFSKLKSSKAHYEFYSNEFTIAGMQSKEVFPYFQITAIKEYKDYFYIYFGEANTYFVSKNGFAKGDAKDFLGFISGKISK